ncbi:MAG TPA: DUF5655 domain-containing protein [Nocardioides sp.]|nr:DUF5655 domain-containing protein [Nocardioides sp.]
MTPEEHFAGHPFAASVFAWARDLLEGLGPCEVRATRSQVAFRRRRGFAYVWMPGRYLAHPAAEVVLSISLPRHDSSPRFKEVVHPTSHQWLHHLEVHDLDELDGEVADWLGESYDAAG